MQHELSLLRQQLGGENNLGNGSKNVASLALSMLNS